MQNRYPDLSKPLYPDLSEPIRTHAKTFMGELPLRESGREMPFLKPNAPGETAQYSKELGLGLGQGLLNIPTDIAGWFGRHPYNRFNFAPNTFRSKVGEFAAPFVGPQIAEMGLMKGLSKIPKIGQGINELTESLQMHPVINSLIKSGKAGFDVGLISALENAQQGKPPKNSFGEGMMFGAPVSLATQLISSSFPFVPLAAKLGLGAMLGQQTGHPGYGALIGAGIPLRALLGIESRPEIAEEMLHGLDPKDVAKIVAANRRLGVRVTPAEASGNPVVGGREGTMQRSEEGAMYGFRQRKIQEQEQRRATENMLNRIYEPTARNERKINYLYDQAKRPTYNLPQDEVNAIKGSPVMKAAFDRVKSKPAFKDIPENNYEFLAEVDRDLYRESQALKRQNKGNEAHYIDENKNPFNKYLKDNNPYYRLATEAYQPKAVRQGIEETLEKTKGGITAKNVYSKLFNTEEKASETIRKLKNFPEAQQMAKDMRTGWKHMGNAESVSGGTHTAKKGLSDARNELNYIQVWLKNIAGGKADIKRLQYIYGKDWEQDFVNLMHIKNQKLRRAKMYEQLTKMGTAYGLNKNQIDNFKGFLESED